MRGEAPLFLCPDIWDHLTESERHRNTITVALVLLDEDGCCGDWVRTTVEYRA